MKKFRSVLHFIFFSVWILSTNCATEDLETEEGIAPSDTGNQIDTPLVDENSGQPASVPASLTEGDPSVSEGTSSDSASASASAGSTSNGAEDPAASAGSVPESAPQLPMDGSPSQAETENSAQPGAENPAQIDQLPSLPQVVAEGEPTDNSEAAVPKKDVLERESPLSDSLAGSSVGTTGEKNYYVKPGDSLSLIAKMIYGSSDRWRELAANNNLTRSSRIYPGDVLQYKSDQDSAGFDAKIETLKRRHVVVKKSDTLASIATRVMGSPSYWKLIWRWNESIVANPQKIFEGQKLEFISAKELTALHSRRMDSKSAH